MDNAKTVLRNCQWVDQPPAEPPKKRKRLVTAKMREANKSNSAKSTGAKTEAGRAASRMNSTRHGAASKTIMFLPGENEQDFWDELDLWIRQRDAKTAEEKACVQSAVYSRWTWCRAINSQAHAVTAAITRIENHFDEAKAGEVRELRKELVSNPDIIVTQLMNSTCGCAFLINELTALSLRLKTHYFLEVSQREHALRLAGHCPNELFTDWVVREFNRSYFGSIRGPGGFTAAQVANALIYDRPSDISEGEYQRRLEPLTLDLPSIEDGHAQLKKYLADWISRLTERKELMGYREAAQKKAAIGEAQTEVSREGQTRARYIAQSDRTLYAALRMVLTLQADRRKHGDPDLEEPTPEDAAGADLGDAENQAPEMTSAGVELGPETVVIPAAEEQTPNEAVTTQVVGPAGGNNAVSAAPAALLKAQEPIEHDPLVAVIEKYQKEFDHLREYGL